MKAGEKCYIFSMHMLPRYNSLKIHSKNEHTKIRKKIYMLNRYRYIFIFMVKKMTIILVCMEFVLLWQQCMLIILII